MKIGFFDSGVGGISVLYQALKIMPNEDYLYYADTEHVPYGVKNKEEVKSYVLEAADFIVSQGVKALVVACNTATSIAIDDLRARYDLPVVGMEPAVKPAVCRLKGMACNKRVLVTATPMTIKEKKLQHLLHQWDQKHIVDLLPLPKLVTLAEAGVFTGEEVDNYLQEVLAPFHLKDYCTVVLGCTHFNFFKDGISRFFDNDAVIIDGSLGTVCYLERILYERGLKEKNDGQIEFYCSGQLVSGAKQQFYQSLLQRLEQLDN